MKKVITDVHIELVQSRIAILVTVFFRPFGSPREPEKGNDFFFSTVSYKK